MQNQTSHGAKVCSKKRWNGSYGAGRKAKSFGHMCYIRAFALSDASAVMPYDYTRLLFAAAIGYFAFAEVPDPWTSAGAAIIVGSAIYIAHREALAKQTPVEPAVAEEMAERSI